MLIPITEILVTIGGTLRASFKVQPGEYTIGRDPGCDIPVNASLVSQEHARLKVDYQQWFIEDLDSSSGTFVNGTPLTSRTQQVWPSQKIQVGRATIELRALAPDADGGSLPPTVEVIREFLPPEVLRDRRYDIGGVVNDEGGMGLILEAIDQPTARTVAMKVMRDQDDGGDVVRFIEEAKVTAQLEHPNIVPVHELGVDEQERVFYTMKFVRGVTLRDVLRKIADGDSTTVAKYPLGALLTVFQKVCDAIAFAHSRGVIHRDLKPQNIMLGDYGEVLLMDWGLAKIVGADSQAPSPATPLRRMEKSASAMPTMQGTILGTVQYMAPEQARGEVSTLDARADIYALGATLFHILALRPSVTGRLPAEIADKVGRGEIDDLAAAGTKPFPHLPDGRIPDSLTAVVRKAMALEQDDRYQSVEELQADVTAYQSGFATSAENASAWKQLMLLIRRHRLAAITAGASLLLIALITTISVAKILAALDEAQNQRNKATSAAKLAISEAERANQALAEAKKANEAETIALAEARGANEKTTAALGEKNKAMERLKETAPDLYRLAGSQVEKGDYDDAMKKITAALDLDPENAAYHLLRGHLLQAQEELTPALEAYRKTLTLPCTVEVRSDAQRNLTLCETILTALGPEKALDALRRRWLHEGIYAQGRHEFLQIIASRGGDTRAADFLKIKSTLAVVALAQNFGTWEKRAEPLAGGGYRLRLENLVLPKVPSFAGLAIRELVLDFARVQDLTFLRGSSVELLSANNTSVVDLSPLAGLPLRNLSLRNTPVFDLRPLSGLPLQRLVITNTRVADLTPLRGTKKLEELVAESMDLPDLSVLAELPLKRLSLRSARGLGNNPRALAQLAACRQLEVLAIPPMPVDTDMLGLRSLPKLRRLTNADGFTTADGIVLFESMPAASDFWKARGWQTSEVARLEKAWLALLKGKFAAPRIDRLLDTGGIELNIERYPDADLNALRGLPIVSLKATDVNIADFSGLAETPIQKLEIGQQFQLVPVVPDFASLRKVTTLRSLAIRDQRFSDLSPLTALPLENLYLPGCSVRDLSLLLTLPLTDLDLSGNPVTSVAALANIPTLLWVTVPDQVYDVYLLKQKKGLEVFNEKEAATKPRKRNGKP